MTEPVYCINLDSRADRLKYMSEQFDRLGLTMTRIPAIDGASVADAARRCPPGRLGVRIHRNAYACFQSHRECWKALVESQKPYAMILEDDVQLSSRIRQCADLDWIPRDADIVRLETFGVRVHVDRGKAIGAVDGELRRLRSMHHGSGAYVISAAAARRLLPLSETISEPVDRFLFDPDVGAAANLVIYQMLPAPAIQGARSQSQETGWQDTSIPERFAQPRDDGPAGNPGKGLVERLRSRAVEEIRAIRLGTNYIVVGHG